MELRAEKISRDFLRPSAPQGFFMAVEETDFSLRAGALIAITGRSGSGKSTLLKMLAGLMEPGTGRVLLGDTDIYRLEEAELARLRNRQIGLAPQTLMALSSLTVQENVLLPCSLYGEAREAKPRAEQLMERLGIAHLRCADPTELSGRRAAPLDVGSRLGARQRCPVARRADGRSRRRKYAPRPHAAARRGGARQGSPSRDA